MAKKVGKCAYCSDPIYEFQEKVVAQERKYHRGCYSIKQEEEEESWKNRKM